LDTVVLLLVELIGSKSKFRLAVVVSQMMRGQAPKYFFLEPPLFRRKKQSTNVVYYPLTYLADNIRLLTGSFSALTLFVDRQKGHPARKKQLQRSTKVCLWNMA